MSRVWEVGMERVEIMIPGYDWGKATSTLGSQSE